MASTRCLVIMRIGDSPYKVQHLRIHQLAVLEVGCNRCEANILALKGREFEHEWGRGVRLDVKVIHIASIPSGCHGLGARCQGLRLGFGGATGRRYFEALAFRPCASMTINGVVHNARIFKLLEQSPNRCWTRVSQASRSLLSGRSIVRS